MVKILLNKVLANKSSDKTLLVASQLESNKHNNQYFKDSLQEIANNNNCDIEIKIAPHYSDRCLQVVDFVSWAAFRKYHHEDDRFLDLVREKIIFEETITL